jgi:hypothetical protein
MRLSAALASSSPKSADLRAEAGDDRNQNCAGSFHAGKFTAAALCQQAQSAAGSDST